MITPAGWIRLEDRVPPIRCRIFPLNQLPTQPLRISLHDLAGQVLKDLPVEADDGPRTPVSKNTLELVPRVHEAGRRHHLPEECL